MGTKADILARLRQDILSLQGCRPPLYETEADIQLGPVCKAFPNATFPVAAIHEFVSEDAESIAASASFITALLSSLAKNHKPFIWIGRDKNIFPPALVQFGIQSQRMIFIHPQKEKDLYWTMEEALRCDAIAGVVGEIREISFTASRRLQLAVEESRVTGFIIRNKPRNLSTVSDARWQITPLPSETENGLPGLGFPKWQIELLKVRNGRPGKWEVVWADNKFSFLPKYLRLVPAEKKKTG